MAHKEEEEETNVWGSNRPMPPIHEFKKKQHFKQRLIRTKGELKIHSLEN